MTFGLGIIGAGAIGAIHAQGASEAGHGVVGFCDVDADKAQAAAATWDARAWSDPAEMLADPEVTAVVVAVPNVMHAPLAIQALEAGVDVLLEKPMAMSAAQGEDVLRARDASGKTLQLGFVCRLAATVMAARTHIDAGRLGPIYQARAVMLRRRGIPGLGGWFTTKAKSGGGVLIDLGPHLVDVILHLCGRPEVSRVSAATSSRFGHPAREYTFTDMWSGPPNRDGTFDVDDGATAMLRCSSGMTIMLETTWASHLPDGAVADGVTLMGEHGALQMDLWGDHVLIGTQLDGEIVDVKHPIPSTEGWGSGFKREHELFRSACVDGTPPCATGEEGVEVQRILDAMYRSAEAGQEIAV